MFGGDGSNRSIGIGEDQLPCLMRFGHYRDELLVARCLRNGNRLLRGNDQPELVTVPDPGCRQGQDHRPVPHIRIEFNSHCAGKRGLAQREVDRILAEFDSCDHFVDQVISRLRRAATQRCRSEIGLCQHLLNDFSGCTFGQIAEEPLVSDLL